MSKITCVVDNAVQPRSPFWGEHGLAFRIEVDQACALFDTGRSGSVLLHNLELLGECPPGASTLILSHAHTDHSGGLVALLSQKPGLPVYASPDVFRPRYMLQAGEYRSIGLPLIQDQLTHLADLHLSDAPAEVLPGLWSTGEIRERPEPEGRSPQHFVPDGYDWQPDPYRDDMSLVLERREGLVVICGCCHAGLLNTLAHVRRTFQHPIVAVLGGTHLMDADEVYLHHIVGELRDRYGSPRMYLNHCTGERAYVALVNALPRRGPIGGDRVHPCPAGTMLTFE
jgi:7,8-dihydropterin-6-yl-methyl-4-(beta-D-ribofuranosyl)aminobenzene 5'-phosphate synthase